MVLSLSPLWHFCLCPPLLGPHPSSQSFFVFLNHLEFGLCVLKRPSVCLLNKGAKREASMNGDELQGSSEIWGLLSRTNYTVTVHRCLVYTCMSGSFCTWRQDMISHFCMFSHFWASDLTDTQHSLSVSVDLHPEKVRVRGCDKVMTNLNKALFLYLQHTLGRITAGMTYEEDKALHMYVYGTIKIISDPAKAFLNVITPE